MPAINKDNFPDDVFRSIVEQKVLSDAEFVDITYIAVPNKNIYSLKGVELFPNLEVLEISYNHITDLDLSQNLRLKELYICENDMKHVKMPHSHILKTLHCYGNKLDQNDEPIKALNIISEQKQLYKKAASHKMVRS